MIIVGIISLLIGAFILVILLSFLIPGVFEMMMDDDDKQEFRLVSEMIDCAPGYAKAVVYSLMTFLSLFFLCLGFELVF